MILLGWFACAAPRPEAILVQMDAWRTATAANDLFPEHRTNPVDCPLATVTVEDGALEVDTGLCDYVLLEQPLLADVRAGEAVEIVFWHNELAALEPAEAHVAFGVAGEVWLDRTLPIPSLAGAYADVVEVPVDTPAGAGLQLHLHNHGANTWNVLRVTRLADSLPP
ncbi:MAG: hypothetical protein AAF211_19030 [Myxococcota bacterium]